MTEVIFGPPALQPRKVWTASDFVSVDDRIRGGSSTSAMKDVDKGSSSEDEGTIDFMGFLDTTTLGGAGFASQAYSQPLPGMPVNQTQYKGLRLCVRPVASASNPEKKPSTGKEGANGGSYPGGGRGAVRSYTLNLKTQEPQRRPDGRRESQIVYEYKIVLPPDTAAPSPALTFDSRWQEFEPTYRGRPAENAPPLDPAQIQEWSIMARSDFGSQSGEFALRLISMSAISRNDSLVMLQSDVGSIDEKRAAVSTSISSPAYVTVPEHGGTSSEYYGFALFIVATVAMVLWIVWALTPDHILQRAGIDWYPNREWAFLIPSWSLFLVLFIYVGFMTLNIHNNPRHEDLSQVVDSHSNIFALGHAVEAGDAKHPLEGCDMAATGGLHGPLAADIYDLPPGFVSRDRHGL